MTLIIILLFLPLCLAEIWTIHVHTGNERYAGTDSNVYIRLFNDDGESTSEMQLTHYNWLPEKNEFPVRNLFETSARERFRIQTEYIGSVSKIQTEVNIAVLTIDFNDREEEPSLCMIYGVYSLIADLRNCVLPIRHNNFPAIQADWLLDKVIVERNQDGTKYNFICNCWLRRRRPSIIITAEPDERTNDKNKGGDSSSKTSQTFALILVSLITLIICIFCCFNEYRRRQRHRSSSLIDTNGQSQLEPSLIDPNHSSPSSPTSGPRLWVNTMRRWKNLRHGLPSYNHARTTESATAEIAVPADEPPAYEDLYPNSNEPINPALTTNL